MALVALAVGFLIAGQLKAQLLTPSNQVARTQALIRSVQDLERTNDADRQKIAALRAQIAALEATAAADSATTAALQNEVANLRAHAGLTPIHGPGVEIDLSNGDPSTDPTGQGRYLVNYQDVQDLVNLMFSSGAEGVAVSGRRITPISSFTGSEGEVVIDQGPPLFAPIKVVAVGDRSLMQTAMTDTNQLTSLRIRVIQFAVGLKVTGLADASLPAYDASLEIPYVDPA